MVAQLVEQRPFKPFVVGSIPTHPTKKSPNGIFLFALKLIQPMVVRNVPTESNQKNYRQ
jgi:hypothetical protein